jgi:hypothetical protein
VEVVMGRTDDSLHLEIVLQVHLAAAAEERTRRRRMSFSIS